MDSIWLVNKDHSFYMSGTVTIGSWHGIRIETLCSNQPNKSKLSMYKPLISL